MHHLILDTSTEKGIVIIAEGSNPIFAKHLPEGFQSSNYLFEAIEEGLSSCSLKVSSLDFVAVTTGPGLFTGIRVGVAAAKGLAYGGQLPIVALSSLSGFISDQKERYFSAIDGRSRGIFVLERGVNGEEFGTMQVMTSEQVSQSEELFVGPSFDRLGVQYFQECSPCANHLSKISYEKRLKLLSLKKEEPLLINY